ncbi:DUF317 domain-containing protein [Streptomyces sp. CS7]|uniref:DUF317 domain-containing protein n=1 Tax=Streptomyces sp. CS-7 TaxID=2906769 RepID=UPI0021B2B39A|nr:DUF317 domain-containing protein [Streptomyces sp. CS-7]MCT6780446.1 DUF317 domain-containing protein [Streptomyces sp. CS-7]
MTPTAPDARVHLDTHPVHCSAVVATVAGTAAAEVRARLTSDGWHPVAANAPVLVLVRIDREEPYWAEQTAKALAADGVRVDISPRLREAMDEEWSWAFYPMPWCTRDEMREVSDQAQQLYDAIRTGRLQIHAHAHDGHTTVAVGTYATGLSVHLHGEDHLRCENYPYDDTDGSKDQAIKDFRRLYGDAVRVGPAPLTTAEREADQARGPLTQPTVTGRPLNVPVYLADPADPEATLDQFLDKNRTWEKHDRWPSEATYALHESLVYGIELHHPHAPGPRDDLWAVAAYKTPVGDRIWRATATAGTPEGIITTLLEAVADEHDWSRTAWATSTTTSDRKPVLPLLDGYSWDESVTDTGSVWASPDGGCRIRHDQRSTWSVNGGEDPQRPSWAMQFSEHTPPEVIQQVVFELAEGLGPRRPGALRSPAARSAPATRPPVPGPHLPPGRGR